MLSLLVDKDCVKQTVKGINKYQNKHLCHEIYREALQARKKRSRTQKWPKSVKTEFVSKNLKQ